jgi:hypothetical protein
MQTEVKDIGSNMTELLVTPDNGIQGLCLLFSYETPVAGWDATGPFQTEKKFSATTTKHINKYLDSYGPETRENTRTVTQEWILEQLVKIK